MDGSIIDDHPGFEWERYAIAWIVIDPHMKGIAAEEAKTDVVHRHAHRMVAQRPNDHFAYTQERHFKHPPSLLSRERRRRPRK